jgi:hypothetical protein
MADASGTVANAAADDQEVMVDIPGKSAGQSRRPTRKQKYTDKTKRKMRQTFAAAMQTADSQAHTKGNGRRKKKRA